jgi:PAS domain S-box-containing protein
MDGILRDVTAEKEQQEVLARLADFAPSRREFSFSLDGSGLIRSIDPAGAEIFGYDCTEMVGNPLSAYIAPKYRQLFSGFFTDLLNRNTVEGILIFNDREGKARHVKIHARTLDRDGERERISGIGRDITRIVESQQERLNQERFQGVMEMAGGVAHRLNQPLTVITNLVNELLFDTPPEDRRFAKLGQVQDQVLKLSEITKKIGSIRKYKSMDYVAGVRIVDIDQAT